MAANIFIKTLGCKVNTFDSTALANQLRAAGYSLVDSHRDADLTVLNSCSVTANAEKEARYLARRYRREKPDSKLMITGCYAQTDSAALIAMPEIDFVVPNQVKEELVGYVEAALNHSPDAARNKLPETVKPVANNRQEHFKSSATLFDSAASSKTRSFLKIQDGCNGFCTYCLIPYARGASRSVAPERVIAEVERLTQAGVPEIVLTGIHIGDYGEDLGEMSFAKLLLQLVEMPGIPPLRISSLEPAEVTAEFLEVLTAYRQHFCDHFHLPLQSGHDRILKLMRRTYTTAEYAHAVQQLRAVFPNANIGADVIPGFPSETDQEFAETVSFIRSLELGYLHVFPYSSRPNTAASRMPNHLDGSVIKKRAAELRALSNELQHAYRRKFIGASLDVLWEQSKDPQGRPLGHTRNFLEVAGLSDFLAPAGQRTHMKFRGFVEDHRLLATQISS